MHRSLYFSSRLGLGLLALLVVLGTLTTSLLLAQHSSHAAGVASSSISAGNDHSLALKPDGTVWAWGNNGGGALGDGTTTERHSPVQVLAGACSGCGTFLTGITAVSAGAGHSLALKSDGTVWAWGYNGQGQLGNNTTTNSTTPVQVLAGACAGCRMTAITAGNQFSLALRSDGTVYGWGSNANGQLGDNTITQRNTPVQVLGVGGTGFLTGITAINTAGSANHSLAVASDGTVYAWGYNSNGQLGDNTTTDRHTPVQVLGVGGMGHLSSITAVAAGGLHSLALNSDGTVWSWGSNGLGSLGDGTSTQRLTPVQVVGVGGTGFLTGVSGISAGVFHSLALKSDGTVYAWGFNAMGQLGDNDAEISSNTPVQVLAGACSVCGTYLTGITAIAAGIDFSLALRSDGTVYGWGSNANGQLGDNTTTARDTPVQSRIDLSPASSANTSYYDQLVHHQGAIAYWPMDEQSGAATAHNEIAADGSNDGTIIGSNGSSYKLGVVGRGPTESSYLLSGGYVTIPNPTGLTTPSFTVTGWVRIPSGPASNGYLFYNGSGQRDGYGLGVFNGSASGFACVAGGVCAGVGSSSVPISDGSWHQLALTKDATTLTLYVDGQSVASNPLSGDVTYSAGEQVDIGRTGPTNSNILSAGVDDISVYDHALAASDISALWPAGACPQSTVSDLATGPLPPAGSLPTLPLTTEGRYIVDHVQHNLSRVKLASVNWYGFEQTAYAPSGLQCAPLSSIVASIAQRGFNSVRLPWATDSWKSNQVSPVVQDIAVAANPDLRGIHLQDLMDKVVNELARQGVMTVLDNHVSRPDWCCSSPSDPSDGNALWWEDYNPASPPNWNSMRKKEKMQLFHQGDRAWKQALSNIVTRYSPRGTDPQPAVVGVDLRNEPRDDTTLHINAIWGGQGTPVYENWQHAATQAGDMVLSINPNLLVMVDGINSGTMLGGFDGTGDGGVNNLPAKPNTNLTGAAGYPIQLTYANGQPAHQLVYAPHNYEFSHRGTTIDKLGQWWGYLLQTGQTYTAPVWLGEFGTCNDNPSTNCLQQTNQGSWWQLITGYLASNDIDWSYWAINGTSGQAEERLGSQVAPPAGPLYCDQGKDKAAKDPNGFRYAGCKEMYGILDSTWQTNAQSDLTDDLQKLETSTQGP